MTRMKCLVLICLVLGFCNFCYGKTGCKTGSPDCDVLCRKFTKALQEFTISAVDNSFPFNFCNETAEKYREVELVYQSISKTVDRLDKNCGDYFFNVNRLDWFPKLKKQADSLWDSASCAQCYKPIEDYNEEFVRTNVTIDFYDFYLKNYKDCLLDYNKTRPIKTLCDYCVGNYTLLNEFYDQVTRHNDQNICFDVTDKMNKTRQTWSTKFNCCNDKKDSMVAFITAASSVVCIVIIFYCSSCIYGRVRRDAYYDPIDETRASSMAPPEPVAAVNEPGLSAIIPASSSDVEPNTGSKQRKIKRPNISDGDESDDPILSSSLPRNPQPIIDLSQ